jgi:hypothetical protein
MIGSAGSVRKRNGPTNIIGPDSDPPAPLLADAHSLRPSGTGPWKVPEDGV